MGSVYKDKPYLRRLVAGGHRPARPARQPLQAALPDPDGQLHGQLGLYPGRRSDAGKLLWLRRRLFDQHDRRPGQADRPLVEPLEAGGLLLLARIRLLKPACP